MSIGITSKEFPTRLHLNAKDPANATGKKKLFAGMANRKANLKQLQRRLSLALLVCFMLFMLSACGSGGSPAPVDNPAPAPVSTVVPMSKLVPFTGYSSTGTGGVVKTDKSSFTVDREPAPMPVVGEELEIKYFYDEATSEVRSLGIVTSKSSPFLALCRLPKDFN